MRFLLAVLLLVAACAPVHQSGLTAEEEAQLDAAAQLLEEEATPLTEVELNSETRVLYLPSDAAAFIARWEACAHWLGEPAWDDARRAQIERAVRETCPGIDEQGRRVRAAHAGYPELLAALRDYEPLGH